jgi:hypothetical protein
VVCAHRLFRSRARLKAEILVLRQQVNALRRTSPKRFVFSNFGRLVLVGLYRLIPGTIDALAIVQPETVICWHRAGFRSFWRWKSRRRGGRPRVPLEIDKLIRDMSLANPLWGAPRIHGEPLELGIDVGQTSVAKYMARGRCGRHRAQGPFLRQNRGHAALLAVYAELDSMLYEATLAPVRHLPPAQDWQQRMRYDLARLHQGGVTGEEVYELVATPFMFSAYTPRTLAVQSQGVVKRV